MNLPLVLALVNRHHAAWFILITSRSDERRNNRSSPKGKSCTPLYSADCYLVNWEELNNNNSHANRKGHDKNAVEFVDMTQTVSKARNLAIVLHGIQNR